MWGFIHGSLDENVWHSSDITHLVFCLFEQIQQSFIHKATRCCLKLDGYTTFYGYKKSTQNTHVSPPLISFLVRHNGVLWCIIKGSNSEGQGEENSNNSGRKMHEV